MLSNRVRVRLACEAAAIFSSSTLAMPFLARITPKGRPRPLALIPYLSLSLSLSLFLGFLLSLLLLRRSDAIAEFTSSEPTNEAYERATHDCSSSRGHT